MFKPVSMKLKAVTALGLCLLVVFGLSEQSYAQSAKDAYQVEEFTMRGDTELEVVTSGGSISVVGKEGNTVEVQMFVRKRGKLIKPSDDNLDDWDFEFKRENGKVRAVAKRENKRGWNKNSVSVSFVVYTPLNTETDLKTSGGSINIENLKGEQLAKTSGGSINIDALEGNVNVSTSGGSIKANDIGGELNARTSGGRIQVTNVDGDIDVKTSGGSISLEGVNGNVSAKTSGGSINAEFASLGKTVDLGTSGGSIKVTVPKGSGLDLDLKGQGVRTDLENFSGSSKRNNISGTVNGGGTRLTAKTSGGSVTLRYN